MELLELLGARLEKASATEWEERLRPLGLAVGAVKELADALDGDLVLGRDMVVDIDTADGPLRVLASPIRFSDSDAEYRAPPRLHEHTADVSQGHSRGG
jgi:crotonobetainyl-CoA:carnitine CoA-transferase CaiB-like acyl-CoA transferase